MIRGIVYDLLRNSTVLNGLGITSDSLYQAGTVDTLPSKPALAMQWGDVTPGPYETLTGASTSVLTLRAHDELGDYDRIDAILAAAKSTLCGATAIRSLSSPGWTLIQADWTGDGPDLRDDGYGTIVRFSNYRVAAGWR
jgi:hypothetical protein